MNIFKRIKEGFIAPQGMTYTPFEPMYTLRKIEIAIMKEKHARLEEYVKAPLKRQAYLSPYLDGLQDAYDMVCVEIKRVEEQNSTTK
jgi:hypothetical protein